MTSLRSQLGRSSPRDEENVYPSHIDAGLELGGGLATWLGGGLAAGLGGGLASGLESATTIRFLIWKIQAPLWHLKLGAVLTP